MGRFVAVVIAALLPAADGAPAVEPRRPGQDSFITRAAFAERRLWMRSDAGVLFSVAPGEARQREEQVPEPVLDLCASGGRLRVLTGGSHSWTIRRLDHGAFAREITLPSSGNVVGMACEQGVVLVVDTGSAHVSRDGRHRSVTLDKDVPAAGGKTAMAVHLMDDQAFVGADRGEWGGAVLRIDLATGHVKCIEPKPGAGCGDMRDPTWNPVHAFAPVPWRPGCVAASIGLQHMILFEGQLAAICGDVTSVLVSRPLDLERALPDATVPFYGVARAGDSLLAAGIDGLYRVTREGAGRVPLPSFTDVGGIKVSFNIPGVALVLSDRASRSAVSGSTPLLAPMD